MSGVALVTGAGRGVGRAVAISLAKRGFRLALLGRPSPPHAEAAALIAKEAAFPPLEVFADFADARALEHAAARVVAELGAPRVVVHNAGMVVRARIEETTVAAWDEQLDVNLRAPFVLTRALLPSMRAAGEGRFVFIGSISGTLGSPGAAAYAASKWGLTGFAKSLAEELKDSGLMACSVLPGSIDTDMLKGAPFPPRMSAEDVARTVEFLAVDAPLAHNGAVVEMFGV
ncbi:MAG TPA: SDR family oxidoreductase [Polyangiaceae bacterium]|nr:SDR family oxidoreductase [Polyangiaceae bacterium]